MKSHSHTLIMGYAVRINSRFLYKKINLLHPVSSARGIFTHHDTRKQIICRILYLGCFLRMEDPYYLFSKIRTVSIIACSLIKIIMLCMQANTGILAEQTSDNRKTDPKRTKPLSKFCQRFKVLNAQMSSFNLSIKCIELIMSFPR